VVALLIAGKSVDGSTSIESMVIRLILAAGGKSDSPPNQEAMIVQKL
jgi:hypothetical protein